jgi:hypothetical protein
MAEYVQRSQMPTSISRGNAFYMGFVLSITEKESCCLRERFGIIKNHCYEDEED